MRFTLTITVHNCASDAQAFIKCCNVNENPKYLDSGLVDASSAKLCTHICFSESILIPDESQRALKGNLREISQKVNGTTNKANYGNMHCQHSKSNWS